MQFLSKWERQFGWASFPGFLRYYAIFHLLVFLLQFVNPDIGLVLDFDRNKILAGEVWRLVTFLFSGSGMGGLDVLGALFMFFMVMIAFMMSDALEAAWGVFRTSVFYYTGYIGLLAANFLYPQVLTGNGYYIYASAFFAFATLFPKVEFLVFFIIPVQIRWLAVLSGLFILIQIVNQPSHAGYLLFAFANYLLWAGIPAMRGQARVAHAMQRQRKFRKASHMNENAFHRCHACDRTELSDPELDFRMSADGKEYCSDHLGDGDGFASRGPTI
jgi:hypothetical protein